MPPRNVRLRGGGSQVNNNKSFSTSLSDTSVAPGEQQFDSNHNTDQPCCSILTRIAREIFPLDTHSFENTTDLSNANHLNVVNSYKGWYTLLREYLTHERKRCQDQDAIETNTTIDNTNKKKKKKKKRKKGSITPANGENGSASATGLTLPECTATATRGYVDPTEEEEGEDDHIVTGTESQEMHLLQRYVNNFNDGFAQNDVTFPMEGNISRSTVDWRQRLQQDQLRRIKNLTNRLIDVVSNHRKTSTTASETSDEEDIDLRQLHDFIATILDDATQSVFTSETDTKIRRNETNSIVTTMIPRKRIEMEVMNISCESCRRGVQQILLPDLCTSKSGMATASIKHPPHRQLLLKNLMIPTVYDTFDHEVEMEQLAMQYQTLMEEGMTPPEHAQHWSFHIQVKEQPPTKRSVHSPTLRTLVTDVPQQEVIGWKLRRPTAPGECLINASSIEKSDNSSTMTLNNTEHNSTENTPSKEWTMNDLEFLIDHYVLLLGLPPDEILEVPASSNLSINDCGKIASDVSGKVRELTTKFHDIAVAIDESYRQFNQIELFRTENKNSNTDWQTFAALRNDVDEACSVAMNSLLNINIDITRAVHRILSHIGGGVIDEAILHSTSNQSRIPFHSRDDAMAESKWAITHCIAIWRSYIHGCLDIVCSRDAYESELFKLAEARSTGRCIPEMEISPTSRALYSSFIRTKLALVSRTIQEIEKALHASTYIGGWHNSCSTNIYATFVSRLHTEDAFYLATYSLGETDLKCSVFDQALEDVLKTVREMTDTVHERRVDITLEKYQHLRDKLHRLLTKAHSNINDSTPFMCTFRLEIETLQRIDWKNDAENNLMSIKSGLIKVVEHWVHYRIFNTAMNIRYEKRPTPIMPYELRRSMLPSTTVLFGEQTMGCTGGNDQHRVICILVGLFFEMLSENFKEWQAHRAAQDLLTTIGDVFDDEKSISVTSKQSKKQKKKVKKPTSIIDNDKNILRVAEVADEEHMDTDDDKTPVPVSLNVMDDMSAIDKLSSMEKPPLQSNVVSSNVSTTTENGQSTVQANPDDYPNKVSDTNTESLVSGGNVTTESSTETLIMSAVVENDFTCHETIVSLRDHHIQKFALTDESSKDANLVTGVYDDTIGFQSAEDFLISRLIQLYNTNEKVVIIT